MKRMCVWFAALLMIALVGVSVAGAQQGTPAQIFYALDDLSSRLGRTVRLNDLQSWRYQIETYNTNDLGCPTYQGQGGALNRATEVYIFDLTYRGTTYQYRVTADGAIRLWCGQLAAVSPTTAPGTATAPPTAETTPEATTEATLAPCPADFAGFLTPRLAVGGQASIEVGGTPNPVRQSPRLSAEQVGIINGGAVADVIGGPICADGLVWWQVSFLDVEGWIAEGALPDTYFIDPVESAEVTQAARAAITPRNAADLVALDAIPIDQVNDLAFTGDGGLLAIASTGDGSVYEFPAAQPAAPLDVALAGASAAAASPDGRYLGFGTFGGEILVLDTESGITAFIEPAPEAGPVNALEFSPDNLYYLAAVQGYTPDADSAVVVRVYALPGNLVILERDLLGTFGGDLAFNLAGDRLYYTDNAVHEINLDTSTEISARPLDTAVYSPLAVQPGTGALAYADGASVRVAVGDETALAIGLPNRATATGLAFSPDGALLAVQSISRRGNIITSTVSVVDAETGEILFQTPNTGGALTFSPDGSLLLVASEDEIALYGVDG